MTVIVTDAKYRAAVAAVRSLAVAGYEVVLTQTAKDATARIPSFKSKYASRTCLIDTSVNSPDYALKLAELAREYDNPVIFPIGAKTLEMMVENRQTLEKCARFTVPTSSALNAANDKECVRRAAEALGIPTPRTYTSGESIKKFPVIVKPRCGEKFGLSAAERYIIARTDEKYRAAYEKMEKFGGAPIVQELISGEGVGVSLLMTGGRAVSAICHKRVREYPQSGGPSACCESFFDEGLVKMSEKLLASLDFEGIAMVEYKKGASGAYLLEINPRIWGSFPLTEKCDSGFACDYAALSCRENITHPLNNYKCGVRMNFILSDIASAFDYLRHGKIKKCFSCFGDIITGKAQDALYKKGDTGVFRSYILLKLGFKEGLDNGTQNRHARSQRKKL